MSEAADPVGHGMAAFEACAAVLRALTRADDARQTPCTEFTVAAVREHLAHSMDLLAVAAGADPAPPTCRDGASTVLTLGQAALDAWRERGFAGSVGVGSRTLAAPLAFAVVPLELAVHGWDLAVATGRSFTLPDDTVRYLLDQSVQLITPERRGRGFAAAVAVSADADALERLIAFTGRDPGYCDTAA